MKVREFYKVIAGEITYLWAAGDETIVHDGDTYTPTVVGRSDMVQREEMNRANITLRVPFDNELAQLLFTEVPDVVVSVTLFRQEEEPDDSEPTTLVHWKGRLAGFRATEQEVLLECESVFTSMRRTGNRAFYQVQCRHALYGTSCGVDKDDYGIPATVTAITGDLDIEISLGAPPAGSDLGADSSGSAEVTGQYFVGGMLRFGDAYRFISNQGVDFVRLWREMPGLQVGSSVTVYPGCNRSLSTCKEVFRNVPNNGAFPWLPRRTPFSFVNNF